jgi:hypothetical protein
VRLGSDLLKVDVVTELHVLGVNLENFETAGWVRNANIDLTIEAAKTTKGRIDRVGAVSGGHDNDVGARLHAVHQGEQLRNDTTLDLAVSLVTLGRNRVDLVDEDDGRRVLFRLLESLSEVGLGFTSHLGHDLGAVDEEEEGSRLVCNGTSHQRLTGTRGSV